MVCRLMVSVSVSLHTHARTHARTRERTRERTRAHVHIHVHRGGMAELGWRPFSLAVGCGLQRIGRERAMRRRRRRGSSDRRRMSCPWKLERPTVVGHHHHDGGGRVPRARSAACVGRIAGIEHASRKASTETAGSRCSTDFAQTVLGRHLTRRDVGCIRVLLRT